MRKLTKAREAKGFTVMDLVRLTHVHHQTLHRLERGETMPWHLTVETAQRIVGCFPSTLLRIEDFFKPPSVT